MKCKLGINKCKFCGKIIYDLNDYALNICGHGYGLTVIDEIDFVLPKYLREEIKNHQVKNQDKNTPSEKQ